MDPDRVYSKLRSLFWHEPPAPVAPPATTLDNVNNFLVDNSAARWMLQISGALLIISIVYRLLSFFYLYFLRPSSFRKYLIDPGNPKFTKRAIALTSSDTKSWALVTGASDGIGKVFANELAQAGFNVILHGRNPKKIAGVLKELEDSNPKTYFRTLIADASKSENIKNDVAAMTKELNALPGPLTVLANNVGGTGPIPRVYMPVRELNHEQVDGLISLNCSFSVQLTRSLLPGILERRAKHGAKAVILNTGSAAEIGVPMQSIYGGAKNYMRAFTYALTRELSLEGYSGISAMYMIVGRVTFAGPWTGPPTLFTPSAKVLAKSILHKMGCGRIEVTPYWGHAMQVMVVTTLPERFITWTLLNEVRRDLADEEIQKPKS